MFQIIKFVGCAVAGAGAVLIGGAIKNRRTKKAAAKKTVVTAEKK